MHLPRTAPRLTRRSRMLVAAIAAAALVTIGMASPASAGVPAASTAAKATAASPSTTPAATPKVSKNNAVKPLCTQPKKGMAQCFALKRTDVTAHKGIQPNATVSGYGPADLSSAYALPANGGAGQTVAIVDAFDDPNAEADLAVYRAQFGLPPCTTANGCFRKVDQRGGTNYPPPDAGWAGEISLDVDMVSAVAPARAHPAGRGRRQQQRQPRRGVDEAVALGAKYVSNSYGTGYTPTPGSGEDPSEVTDVDPHYNHPGVAVVASTGDDDFGVSYPAASQYVTAVGGTTPGPRRQRPRLVGVGLEQLLRRSGQRLLALRGRSRPGRPTAAAACAPSPTSRRSPTRRPASRSTTPTRHSGWGVFGGTSASSPIIAGVFADAGTPVAGTYPSSYPYANAARAQRRDHRQQRHAARRPTCAPPAPATTARPVSARPNGLAAFTTGPHGTSPVRSPTRPRGTAIAGATVTVGRLGGDHRRERSLQRLGPGRHVRRDRRGVRLRQQDDHRRRGHRRRHDDRELRARSRSRRRRSSGTVTDGSGHGWPLYATITVDGVPGGPVFTDPYTGHYSLTLPQGADVHAARHARTTPATRR